MLARHSTRCHRTPRGVVADRGSAKLLVEYGDVDLGRVEPEAAWKDVKTLGMLDDVDKFAVVTDKSWIGKLGEAVWALAAVNVQVFDHDRRDEALLWLRS